MAAGGGGGGEQGTACLRPWPAAPLLTGGQGPRGYVTSPQLRSHHSHSKLEEKLITSQADIQMAFHATSSKHQLD